MSKKTKREYCHCKESLGRSNVPDRSAQRSWLHWHGLQDLIEANWSRVKIAVESVWKFVQIVQNRVGTTFWLLQDKNQQTSHHNNNIKYFKFINVSCLFFCVVSCWLHASGAFFACCRTCKVLILTQIIIVQCIAKYIIYSWNLPSFFYFFLNCGWTFGESNSNKSLQIWWISETRRLVSTLRLWPLILSPQMRQSEARLSVGCEYP